jgi:cellulose synthase operon protein YhjQ
MTIVSLVSIKGGVGKSTLTASLASAAARRLGGHRVVAIDLDPQNNLSWHLGLGSRRSLGLVNTASAETPEPVPVFSAANGLRCMAFGEGADTQRQALEDRLADNPTWLSQLTRNSGEAMIAFIDTPPGRSVFQRHAMANSQIVLAIVQPDAASYATIADIGQSLKLYAVHANCFYVLNNYEPRDAFAIDSAALLREQFGKRLAPVFISRDEGLREALALQQTSLQYDPHSQASHDIDQLSRWLLELLR